MTRIASLSLSFMVSAAIASLFALVAWQSLPAFQNSVQLLTTYQWSSFYELYGTLSMFFGTFVVSLSAMLIAVPIGLGAAISTSEFLPNRLRLATKIAMEFLAGIPSVVYGLLGVLYLQPLLYPLFSYWGAPSADTLITGGILLSLMVLPTMMTLSEDALRSVPRRYRQNARALGLTRTQVVFHTVLPQARSGIIGAALLSFGRAIGETIAIYLVVGRRDNFLPSDYWHPGSWLNAGQTLTTKLGGSELGVAYGNEAHWSAMMALAFLLSLLIGFTSLIGRRWTVRVR